MKLYKLANSDNINVNEEVLICDEIISAENFFEKLFGLIFRNLKVNQGFLIKDCNSIHTFWMRYKIDLLFLNKNNEIVRLYENFKQFRVTPVVKYADKVIELPASTINKNFLKTGDKLRFI
ncbi:DUF192 domain-containing protein [bacterium]|nr:DUF192 domain-containing protein [bacterium]